GRQRLPGRRCWSVRREASGWVDGLLGTDVDPPRPDPDEADRGSDHALEDLLARVSRISAPGQAIRRVPRCALLTVPGNGAARPDGELHGALAAKRHGFGRPRHPVHAPPD